MSLEQTLKSWLEPQTAAITGRDDVFVVEITHKRATKYPGRLLVLIDADAGLTIENCSAISRALANHIEENNLIDEAFNLEVSSPGVDFPLNSARLYKKNVGRTLKVLTTEGETLTGTLQEATDQTFTLTWSVKAKGQKTAELFTRSVPYTLVKKAQVQVSFQ